MSKQRKHSEILLTANYFAQLAAAAKQRQEMHQKLLAAGARWDGMDGYDFSATSDAK